MESLPDIIASLPTWIQIIIAVAALFTLIWIPLPKLIFQVGRWIMSIFRPQRRNWLAFSVATPPYSDIYKDPQTDANNAWRKDRRRWSNGKPMEVSDWYELIFDKPRTLSSIAIKSYDRRFPNKLRFRVRKGKNDEWEDAIAEANIEIKYDNQPTIFSHLFREKRKISGIRLEIIEPNREKWIEGEGKDKFPAWAIYDIDVKECLLLGRFWEHEI